MKFDFPVISVGNLSAGGTGKTPHIEFILHGLLYRFTLGVLSRGYGRKTQGYKTVSLDSSAAEVGDEPLQVKMKFPDTQVVVGEDRVLAVPRMLSDNSSIDAILLDDAFQHRRIRPGLSILLTDYDNLFTRDHLLPRGWLREDASNYHRADLIVVTKCPASLSQADRQKVIDEIRPFRYQRIYFSGLRYDKLYSFTNPQLTTEIGKETDVLLVSGIARNDYLKKYLEGKVRNVFERTYRDHHRFDSYDMEVIRETFANIGSEAKIIVTTEKDAVRLTPFRGWFLQNKIEIFVQPVRVEFLQNDGELFLKDIENYIEVTGQQLSNN